MAVVSRIHSFNHCVHTRDYFKPILRLSSIFQYNLWPRPASLFRQFQFHFFVQILSDEFFLLGIGYQSVEF